MADTPDTNGTSGKMGGNTKSRHFTFTLNNYKEEDIEVIKALFDKYTFQEEAGTTPHIQGVGSFNNARSFKYMKKSLPRAHIEVCRNLKASIAYCTKIDTRKGRQWSTHIAILKDPIEGKALYDWQQEILDIIKTEPDFRSIYWFWSKDGDMGKSSFIRHVCITNKNATCVNGKAADMLFALSQVLMKNPHINTVFMDIPRCVEHISYNGLEQIKNGMIFSSKYESGCTIFNPPHIIVVGNRPPDLEEMSKDRWRIREINSGGEPPQPP